MAMSGQNCVAIAVDKRFGSGPQMVNVSPRHVLIPNSRLVVAFTGLGGDCQSLAEELSIFISSKMGRASGFGFGGGDRSREKSISPRAMAALTSHVLYGRRRAPYYVEPIIAGLEPVVVEEDAEDEDDNKIQEGGNEIGDEGSIKAGEELDNSLVDAKISKLSTKKRKKRTKYQPYLCTQDVIGAKSRSDSFVCAGAASKSLYGTAEAMWRPGLKPDELARVCGRAFLSALERDCLSGYGAIVYVIIGGKSGEIIEYNLACRSD